MRLLLAVLASTLLIAATDTPPTRPCEECPKSKPCQVSFQIQCNTCGREMWCINGKWYNSDTSKCTAIFCGSFAPESPPPLEPEKENK
jgi:hypothetical protein